MLPGLILLLLMWLLGCVKDLKGRLFGWGKSGRGKDRICVHRMDSQNDSSCDENSKIPFKSWHFQCVERKQTVSTFLCWKRHPQIEHLQKKIIKMALEAIVVMYSRRLHRHCLGAPFCFVFLVWTTPSTCAMEMSCRIACMPKMKQPRFF